MSLITTWTNGNVYIWAAQLQANNLTITRKCFNACFSFTRNIFRGSLLIWFDGNLKSFCPHSIYVMKNYFKFSFDALQKIDLLRFLMETSLEITCWRSRKLVQFYGVESGFVVIVKLFDLEARMTSCVITKFTWNCNPIWSWWLSKVPNWTIDHISAVRQSSDTRFSI